MINLKQLHHFWLVGRTGSIQRAAETSGLTPQTISGQIGVLEGAIGRRLLQRKGRGIELTEAGRIALRYAEQIFRLAEEMEAALAREDEQPTLPYRLGLLDIVPKSLAALLLEPVLEHQPRLRLSVIEDPLPRLLSELMLGRLDALITDGPPPAQLGNKLQCRLLIESRLALYAGPASLAGPLPQALDGAPCCCPAESAVRASRCCNSSTSTTSHRTSWGNSTTAPSCARWQRTGRESCLPRPFSNRRYASATPCAASASCPTLPNATIW